MICPQCGYERVKSDDIISFAECPKCGIIYSKWKIDSTLEDKTQLSEQPSQTGVPTEINRKMSAERLVIYAGIVVVLIIFLHAFIVPLLIKHFKSPKNDTNIAEQIDTSREVNQPAAENSRVAGSEAAFLQEKTYSQTEFSVANIARANRESVVIIKTSVGAIGSGFFINREGYIVTNKGLMPKNGV